MKKNCISTLLSVCALAAATALAADKPNILFIAIDDLRPQLGCYGEPEPITPNIDRLAAEGTRFDRAYVCYPLCLPSRAALNIGKRVTNNKLPDGTSGKFHDMIAVQQTLPKTLRNAGYYTAVHGKFYHGGVPKADVEAWDVPGEFWIDDIHDWSPEIESKMVEWGGRQDQMDKMNQDRKGNGALVWASIDGPDNLLNDGKVADKTIELLRNRPKNRPFFIVAGFSRPHMPWVAPKKYFDMYPEDAGKLAYVPEGRRVLDKQDLKSGVGANGEWNEGVTDEQAQKLIRGYMASTTYVDAQVGKLLAELKVLGLEKDTIVVLWGDHGYHLTDHGLWRKNTPYHVSLRCPLIFRVPGTKSGQVVERVVENIDIYPTLLELAETSVPSCVQLDGKSLVPLLKNPVANIGGEAFTSAGNHYGLVTDQYRFTILKNNKGYKLFDLKKDPGEWNNLAEDPKYKELIEKYAAKVRTAWGLN
ncbi:sulfatase [Pontiella agarivorans]|uniref:Sulfatase n=1 Tax=Pontiella agarivorans TaxID=3038953 RepID=A0ABU5MY69_9BACT|nr:sulfatase [Pontiella agarivorans]MDZ8119115.1 sulfatase [Pontiella agarivorans]